MALASVTSNSCLTTTSLRSQNVSFFLEVLPCFFVWLFCFYRFWGIMVDPQEVALMVVQGPMDPSWSFPKSYILPNCSAVSKLGIMHCHR